jgi:amino acid adenylation domain-containing protein
MTGPATTPVADDIPDTMTDGAPPTLLDALARHAEHNPKRGALRVGAEAIGYAQLYRRIEAAAGALAELGVGPGDRVAVVGDKSTETIIGLLAVLRAGAAYVPLDPHAPPLRWAQLIRDASCAAVLSSKVAPETATGPEYDNVRVLRITDLAKTGDREGDSNGDDSDSDNSPAANLPTLIDPDSVAYCMYTSGSTGIPKGVQITHRAISAFFSAVHPLLQADGESRCMNTSALHFDVSVVDLLYPLWCGATVFLTPAVLLPPLLLGIIEREQITHMAAVGSTVTLLAELIDGSRDISALRRLMTGGEVIDPGSVQRWLAAAPALTVINGYGPTEATCLVLAEPIDVREPGRTAPYPIGRPLPGVTLRFLAEDGAVTLTGPGEIAVAGDQVMLGYLDRPQEQSRVFVEIEGVRFYHTGDLGALRPDGSVEFQGRRDDEVKHRGYRVNLQEVRRTVEQHSGVSRAVAALVTDDRGRPALGCAVLPPDGPTASPNAEWRLHALPPAHLADLRLFVSGRLPRYMTPDHFMTMTAMPMLSSGKPDTARIVDALRNACSAPNSEAA